jgi:hypothetical protein
MENYKVFKLPSSVISDIEGFTYLSKVTADLLNVEEESIFFDFSECTYFEINLCCILGSAFQDGVNEGKKFYLSNVENSIKNALQNIGFLERDSETISGNNSNQVTYTRFKIDDEIAIMHYVEHELLDKPGIPMLTNDLKKEIVRNILEIYVNAVVHAECQYVYSCGSVHKRSSYAELHFTLVDIGKTIKRNVNNFLGKEYDGGYAINWATSDYNTTKVNESGGLGLKLMKQFLLNNNGKMQIVSSDGFWQFTKDNTQMTTLVNEFPGTIVNLIFNLKDTKLHYLDQETTPAVSEIF